MIESGFVEDALMCLRRAGKEPGPILKAIGLPDPVVTSVTAEQYGQLWLAIVHAMDDEFFGLAARPMRPGSFSLLCHAVLHARSLEHALRRALRFLRVVLDAPYGELQVTSGGLARIVLHDAGVPRSAFAYRTFWIILMGLMCWLTGRRIPLYGVNFACPVPEHRTDYHRFFGAPAHFNQPVTCMTFDASYLLLPSVRSEQMLKTFLRNAPANLLIRYRHETTTTVDVRKRLKITEASTWPTFETMAQQLGMAPATLRRKLAGEGQSYAAIKDEVRRAHAQALLCDSSYSIAEVANALGFAEPSAFHRAFKKWTGSSPGTYRREIRH